jgi:hypothetical protein
MALGNRIKHASNFSFSFPATATVATLATVRGGDMPSVAKVASVAVARGRNKKNEPEIYNEVHIRRIDKNTVDFNGQICPVDETGMAEVSFNSSTDKEYASTEGGGVSHAEPVSCFSCGHYDGRGSAWPGMCRYYETLGQEAKEIDFDKVDVSHGCKCYTARRLTPELVSSIKRQKLHGDDPGYVRCKGHWLDDDQLNDDQPDHVALTGGALNQAQPITERVSDGPPPAPCLICGGDL